MEMLANSIQDKNEFAKFIRDLSSNLTNVKHLLEDYENSKKELSQGPNKEKKNVVKKKDLIISQNMEKKKKELVQEDLKKVDYYMKKVDDKNPYTRIKSLKTDEGIKEYKFRLLDYYWSDKKRRKKYMDHVMNLYFGSEITDCSKEKYIKILDKIHSKLDDYDYKLFMMKELSHLLPPLNIYEKKDKKLDEWQIEVINHMKNKESVIVKAPTSSGKSFVGYSAGVIHKRILYVTPATPIAYQVGANFTNMGYKVCYLLHSGEVLSYDDRTNIFVGTPKVIEDYLYSLNLKFDYAVFDEIHNLNKEDDGHMYENLTKMIDCNFLALSATVSNVYHLKEFFSKIHPHYTINLVEFKKRFINQQRWIWNGTKIQKLHPLACITREDLNQDFLQSNLQFTPNDSATLWETMEEIFDSDDVDEVVEIDKYCLSPDEYFVSDSYENRLLTLDDTREYENHLKKALVYLGTEIPNSIDTILSSFHTKYDEEVDANTIITFFKECKKNDFLPMLLFNTDKSKITNLFYKIHQMLVTEETMNYPYYNKILEKKNELFQKHTELRQIHSDKIKLKKTNDARSDKQEKMDKYDKEAKAKYTEDMTNFYNGLFEDIKKTELSDKVKELQRKNLSKEFKEWLAEPDFCYQDIFKKHPKYCFTSVEPMSGSKIKEVRREIQKTLGVKIQYEHPLFQLLKRGIGLYTEDMPEQYKWILQKLMTDREIGIVLSDRTLCLGIDLPIRTTCLLGLNDGSDNDEFTVDDYLQMSGRAGRRGLDTRGNTIFYNVDYQVLMKGELPEIRGSDKMLTNRYNCLNKDVSCIYLNYLHASKKSDESEYIEIDPKFRSIQWLLRESETKIEDFLMNIDKINRELFGMTGEGRELLLLNQFRIDEDFKHDYKMNKLKNDKSFELSKMVNEMCLKIHNSLKDKKYNHFKEVLKEIFLKTRKMNLDYVGLE